MRTKGAANRTPQELEAAAELLTRRAQLLREIDALSEQNKVAVKQLRTERREEKRRLQKEIVRLRTRSRSR